MGDIFDVARKPCNEDQSFDMHYRSGFGQEFIRFVYIQRKMSYFILRIAAKNTINSNTLNSS